LQSDFCTIRVDLCTSLHHAIVVPVVRPGVTLYPNPQHTTTVTMFKSILLYSLLPLLALAQETATATQSSPTSQHTTNTGYNGGEDNPQDPSDAGAAGSSNGAFTLSKGGLAAIIIVAVIVAVGGSKSINAFTRCLFGILTAHQLHLPFSSGLQRSVSGTSVSLFAAHLDASLAAPTSTRPTNAKTDELVCD